MYYLGQVENQMVQLIDDYYDCIYVLKGRDRSLVIDLGMSKDIIKPVLEEHIENDYDVVCTNGHIDHVGRSGEFDHIYMSLNDKEVFLDNFRFEQPRDRFTNTEGLDFIEYDKILDMKEEFDLGDRKIYSIPCFGHTAGCHILVDPVNKYIFTGDAIGAGCGVWMQVDRALSIEEYYHSLVHLYNKLKEFGADENWKFFGGHAFQEYHSKVSEFNKFDIYLLEDMVELCDMLLHDNVEYVPRKIRRFSTGQPYFAHHKKAELIFTLKQIGINEDI